MWTGTGPERRSRLVFATALTPMLHIVGVRRVLDAVPGPAVGALSKPLGRGLSKAIVAVDDDSDGSYDGSRGGGRGGGGGGDYSDDDDEDDDGDDDDGGDGGDYGGGDGRRESVVSRGGSSSHVAGRAAGGTPSYRRIDGSAGASRGLVTEGGREDRDRVSDRERGVHRDRSRGRGGGGGGGGGGGSSVAAAAARSTAGAGVGDDDDVLAGLTVMPRRVVPEESPLRWMFPPPKSDRDAGRPASKPRHGSAGSGGPLTDLPVRRLPRTLAIVDASL
jgi:hypothetical protein